MKAPDKRMTKQIGARWLRDGMARPWMENSEIGALSPSEGSRDFTQDMGMDVDAQGYHKTNDVTDSHQLIQSGVSPNNHSGRQFNNKSSNEGVGSIGISADGCVPPSSLCIIDPKH